MKKNYHFRNFILPILCFLALNASAQLSGVVTINSASVTAGTNYQTFTALANTLNAQGVSGPLTVNVVALSGPYNEQVNFNQAPGISATNTITINGNGCTLTFNSSNTAAPHTLMYTGADYMTVNNLNIVGLGATYALAGHLWSNANNNTFNNCTFSVTMAGTVTGPCPFSLSGSGTSAVTSGASGNNNTLNTCTMTGGYYNTVFYGATATPFNTNNRVINSYMVDFYSYGFYNLYCQNSVAKGNVIERLNRANSGTCYAIYLSTGSIVSELIEGNHIRKLFDAQQASTSAAYCIYVTVDATVNNENIIRNNIISDIKSGGAIYGIYLSSAAYAMAYNNTLSFDDQATTGTGVTYAMYITGPNETVKNNIVYVSRSTTGAKYCIYATVAGTPGLVCDNNVLVMTSTVGTNGTAYLGSAYATLAAWQAGTGYDLNGSSANPNFANPSNMNYTPTNLAINNLASPMGLVTDFNNVARSLPTPDPGAIEFFTTPCSGAPGTNSVVAPTASFCPGATVNLAVASTYTTAGYSYQWVTSNVSVVGPFTVVPSATLATYTTAPINANTYFSAIITCVQANSSITALPGYVVVAGITTSNVPYYESFETLAPNKLPNCSWSASNFGSTSLTQTVSNTNGRIPRTGANFASFYSTPATTNYFYTNGINLKAGVTYSASLWYITDLQASTNWSDLSILVGPNQSPSGLNQIVSTNGPASSPNHKSLSSTFTVAVSGIYYVAVKGTAAASGAPYLSWDDLLIEIPCQLNNPYPVISTNYTTACSGAPFSLTASGANTYTWSNGSNAPAITVTPAPSTTSYYVIGTSTLSGCTKTVTQPISVNLSPPVVIFAGSGVSCAGKSVTLTAAGAFIYNWDNGSTSPSIVVSPTATTSYSVIGVNAAGCSSMAIQQITVNPLPNIITASNANQLCSGESVTLTGIGAVTYQWSSNANTIQYGNPLVVSPQSSAVYTVTGTDNKGCSNTAIVTLEVNECTGLNELSAKGGIRVYPNPTHAALTVEFRDNAEKTIQVLDVTGRLLQSQQASGEKATVDLSSLSGGVYIIKAVTGTHTATLRVVKQD